MTMINEENIGNMVDATRWTTHDIGGEKFYSLQGYLPIAVLQERFYRKSLVISTRVSHKA